jgi:uncharacterized SAM-binding protein YcdF (DUF218 family)
VILAGLLALVSGLSALDLGRRRAPGPGAGSVAQAVVFTGQFYRIPPALTLLGSGRIERLFVSGVNPGAGLSPDRFLIRFAPAAPWLPAALDARQVELGTGANSTLENAQETACWYRRAGLADPLLLITSRGHMPRASLALEAALPGVEIRRAPVDGPDGADPWYRDLPRYLATRALLLAPPARTLDCPPG